MSYWGGCTEHGELLHLATGSVGQYARSACGLVLTGGAYDVPPDVDWARCRKCGAVAANTRSVGGESTA